MSDPYSEQKLALWCIQHPDDAAAEIERLKDIIASSQDAHLKYVGETTHEIEKLRYQLVKAREATIHDCMEAIGIMRSNEAYGVSPKYSGQRGKDRSDALYDAYLEVGKLLLPDDQKDSTNA